MTQRQLTCIGCPMGCQLTEVLPADATDPYVIWYSADPGVVTVDPSGVVTAVTGNTCKRGDSYARKECVAPARTVTGTVRCIGGLAPVVSVRTEGEVPKEKVFDVAHALNTALAHLPIAAGDVVIPDVCGTGVNVIATKSAK